jgi:ubiquitin carboxyl-terminal hydrolase 8
MSGNDFVSGLVRGRDYEIISVPLVSQIRRFFPTIALRQRPYLPDFASNRSDVVFSPVPISIYVDDQQIQTQGRPTWTLSDLRRYLMTTGTELPVTRRFRSPNFQAPLSEEAIIGALQSLGHSTVILHLVEAPPSSPSPMSEFLSVRMISPFPKPIGLYNLGNTCYMNSAIQCLSHVQPLTGFVLSPAFDRELPSHGRIARAYRDFLMDHCSGKKDVRNPSKLRSAVCEKYRQFSAWRQHDSQEFLGALLDGLHEDMKKSFSSNVSPIQQLFHGRLFSRVDCPRCGVTCMVHEPFLFLSLPLSLSSNLDLVDCLKRFSDWDRLDEKNKWKCETCGNMVQADKRMGIEYCGPFLMIHLKRFHGVGIKIDTPVAYPDVLDAEIFGSPEMKGCKYRLIGAILHQGTLGMGHYTAVALDEPSGSWFHFSDSVSVRINASKAHSGNAYVLFYAKELD